MKPLSELPDDELARLAQAAPQALPDAPPWLVASAVAMWQPMTAAPGPSLAQRLVAVLRFDSWAPQPTLAVRAAASATRQVLFTARQGLDLDLRITPDPGGDATTPVHTLRGQVLGPCEGGTIALNDGPDQPLDEFGEFHFGGLAAGSCRLLLRVGALTIDLPEIVIGDTPPA